MGPEPSASSLTGADFGAWITPGDTALTVDWSITTSPFGSAVYSGTANLSQSLLFQNSLGFDVDLESFVLGNLSLAAGTYYLELQNGTVNNKDLLYWDENDGKSLAFENLVGPIDSESFDIFGTATKVPEPASLAALAVGLCMVGYARRRREV